MFRSENYYTIFCVAFSSLFHCFLSTPFKNRCHPWKAYREEQMILRQKCHTNICLRVCLRRDFMVMVDDHQMNYDVFPNVIQDTWQNHILKVSCRGWMKVVCMNNKWLFKNCFVGNYEYQKTWTKNGSFVPHQPGCLWYRYLISDDNAEIIKKFEKKSLGSLSVSCRAENLLFKYIWLIWNLLFLFH